MSANTLCRNDSGKLCKNSPGSTGASGLAWAACLCNEGIYNLLLLKGADPDAQDSYGNTVLHMVVVADQLGMYGYALRHPLKSANANIRNQRALTCLTLSCELGRDECFKDMLELSATEFWRYSNITCCGYPLGALDSIEPSGQTSEDINSNKNEIVGHILEK